LEQFYFLPQNKKLQFLKVMESINHESPAHRARSSLLRIMFEYFESLSLVPTMDSFKMEQRARRLLDDLDKAYNTYRDYNYVGMNPQTKEPIYLCIYGLRAGVYAFLLRKFNPASLSCKPHALSLDGGLIEVLSFHFF
jgi:hypothetical protein